MGIINNRWLTALIILLIPLIVTACFQQVGDEDQGLQVSLLVSETSTATPTETPQPTEEVTEEATAADLPISNNPTATETETATPTETEEPLIVAQADEATTTPDAFELRATQLIEDATNTAVAPLTQEAATLIGATATPTATDLADGGLVENTPSFSGGDCVHEVRAGETMYSLSRYYGIAVMDIANRNGVVNPNIISIAQRLVIPNCGTTGALPPPTSVPTPTLTPFQLPGTGGTDLGDPGQGGGVPPVTSVNCASQYNVQQYDSLFQISIRFGVPVQSIANANGIVNINRIDMGDVLCIPSQ
ncbi:MAG: LysM peptidoglycan-binding domain-containing protein [Anaerolineae bacterium]